MVQYAIAHLKQHFSIFYKNVKYKNKNAILIERLRWIFVDFLHHRTIWNDLVKTKSLNMTYLKKTHTIYLIDVYNFERKSWSFFKKWACYVKNYQYSAFERKNFVPL